jgi:hypothetical protein
VQLFFYIENFNSGDGNRAPKIREKENGFKNICKGGDLKPQPYLSSRSGA